MTINVTKRAATAIAKQLEKRNTPSASIRLGIKGGGCTGYSYVFEFDDNDPRTSDHVFECHEVTVLVDPKSMVYLKDTEVDFETGIRGHGFKFDNPNTSNSCGCGESINF